MHIVDSLPDTCSNDFFSCHFPHDLYDRLFTDSFSTHFIRFYSNFMGAVQYICGANSLWHKKLNN